jgi:hypothetical protein
MRAAIALALLLTGLATAQEVEAPELPELPLGRPATVALTKDAPARFAYEATEPGVLCVSFRLEAPSDVLVEVLDATRQRPPGRSLAGDQTPQAKQFLVATLPEAGRYEVLFRAPYDPAGVQFVAGFLPFPPAAEDRDLDAPSALKPHALVADQPFSNLLGPTDARDWFLLNVETSGTLVVRVETRSESTHALKLEAFRGPALDLQGVWPARWDHKAKQLQVEKVAAGEQLYLKLELSVGTDPVPYTIRTEVRPLQVEEED